MDERRQFHHLLRGFSCRFLDNEFLSAEGDADQTMVHVVALLGALGVSLSLFFVFKYAMYMPASLAGVAREGLSWPDKQFLISLSMTAIGLAVVVTWDALFPDRRDSMTLSALPIRGRTIFAAKACSVLLVFGVITAALNLPTAITLPAMLASSGASGFFRGVFAHVVAVCGAGIFVFAAFLSVQGLLIHVLRFRFYKLVSTWIQLAALLALMCMFFLTPQVAYPHLLGDPRNHLVTRLVPVFWFVGLYEDLLGTAHPAVQELAAIAWMGLGLSVGIAALTYSLGYSRYMRKTVEEADTVAADARRRDSFLHRLLDRFLLPGPLERAVFHFGARTMARNRKHRLLLAIYAGLGIAYVFNGASWLIHNQRAPRDGLFDLGISSVPLILSFLVMFGMRMVFVIPVELGSNWIFRLTETGRPAEYLSGVRKLMLAVGILPLALGTFPIYCMLWGTVPAARHLLLVVLILLVAMEYLVREFPKIPFTCSFLPGKANLKATVSIYVVLFLTFATAVTAVERALLRSATAYWKGAAVIALVLLYRAWRRHRWERRLKGFTYEEKPPLLVSLDLQP